jgi:hypothetical protein
MPEMQSPPVLQRGGLFKCGVYEIVSMGKCENGMRNDNLKMIFSRFQMLMLWALSFTP